MVDKPIEKLMNDAEMSDGSIESLSMSVRGLSDDFFKQNKTKAQCADPGEHYRYEYRGIKLDPYRIAEIYGITDNAVFHILKKCLRCGRGKHKDTKQDLLDIINAAQRRLEMLDEDKGLYDA